MVDYVTELRIDGAWEAITPDVRDADPIAIAHGRRDWASQADPATCTLKLNNGASIASAGQFGRYSPRNPRSNLYGKLARNTPLRVRRNVTRESRIALPGLDGSYLSTPDASSLDITGDIDIRLEITPVSWRPYSVEGTDTVLAAKWRFTDANQRSWLLVLLSDGRLQLRTTTDGTLTTLITTPSTVAVPAASGRLAVRVTLDVDNGASGNTVVFYTAPDIDGTWTQLGSSVVNSGTTSIFNSTADVAIGTTHGGASLGTGEALAGHVHAFELRNGINGAVRTRVNATGHEPEDRTLAATDGRTWTLYQSAAFTDPSIRFTGEVASWPPKWDLSGADHWVPLTAAGITRRLQQGTKSLKSSLFRDLSTRLNVAAYWPMEEPDGAVRFNSGRSGDTTYLAPSSLSAVNFAANEDFVASAPLPTVGTASIDGQVPPYARNIAQRFVLLIAVPEAGMSTDRHLARFSTTGSMGRWDMIYAAGGGGLFRGYDSDGTLIFEHATGSDFNGTLQMHTLWLEQQGGNVFFQWARFPVGSGTAFVSDEGLVAGTFGRFASVQLGTPVGVEGTAFGHLALLNGDVHSIWDVAGNSLDAWAGEGGAGRMVRLGVDEGLPPVRIIGAGAETEGMGPQRLLTLMDLVREVPTADLGILTDAPDAVGLQYRTRTSLYNQDPAVVLDYTTGVIAEPFTPVDDDQNTRNSVEVTRVRGSSFTATQETGPLSIQDPPSGVGKYDIRQELNIADDGRLSDQAFWRLHLGTIDEARWPTLRIDLRNARAELLIEDLLAVRVGDIIRITNPPLWLPGGPYDLFVEGWTETKTAATHFLEFNCSPGSAWTVGVVAGLTETVDPDEPKRCDTAGTQRNVTTTATATSFGVTITSGPLWTTDPDDFPFDIMMGGERMRVTAISGAASPQTFTVVRSVNGVVKSHPAFTTIALYQPARCAL